MIVSIHTHGKIDRDQGSRVVSLGISYYPPNGFDSGFKGNHLTRIVLGYSSTLED